MSKPLNIKVGDQWFTTAPKPPTKRTMIMAGPNAALSISAMLDHEMQRLHSVSLRDNLEMGLILGAKADVVIEDDWHPLLLPDAEKAVELAWDQDWHPHPGTENIKTLEEMSKVQTCNMTLEQIAERDTPVSRQVRRKMERDKRKKKR